MVQASSSAEGGQGITRSVSLLVAAVGVVWLAVFLSAEKLQQKLGPQVMTAFERLMGLILTAMSIEMLLGGIREFVQSL